MRGGFEAEAEAEAEGDGPNPNPNPNQSPSLNPDPATAPDPDLPRKPSSVAVREAARHPKRLILPLPWGDDGEILGRCR